MDIQFTIKNLVKKGRIAKFTLYSDKKFWYRIDDIFDFPVPLEDTEGAIFKSEDRAIFFMRWIRKYLDEMKNWGN